MSECETDSVHKNFSMLYNYWKATM